MKRPSALFNIQHCGTSNLNSSPLKKKNRKERNKKKKRNYTPKWPFSVFGLPTALNQIDIVGKIQVDFNRIHSSKSLHQTGFDYSCRMIWNFTTIPCVIVCNSIDKDAS